MAEYYITDGEKFIKKNVNNQYKTVSNVTLADRWNREGSALAILNNSIPVVYRNTFYVAVDNDGVLEKCRLSGEEMCKQKKDIKLNKKMDSYDLELYSFERDVDVQRMIAGFEAVKRTLESTRDMSNKLQKELLTLEYMFEDVKHYRLKRRLGTVDSYKFKVLGDEIIAKRMSVKNRIEILNKINQHRQTIEGAISSICQTIYSVRNKRYVPRILLELFENGTLDFSVSDYVDRGISDEIS